MRILLTRRQIIAGLIIIVMGGVLIVAVVERQERILELKSQLKSGWPNPWLHLGRLNVMNVETLPIRRDTIPDSALASFDAFHAYAERSFVGYPGVPDDTVARVLHYINQASNLFPYGNRDNPEKPGCVRDNETLSAPLAGCIAEARLLNSPVGCCTDYAIVMHALLTRAGYDARFRYGKGHIFNEVLGSQPMIADANTGTLVLASWEQIRERRDGITVYRMPLRYTAPGPEYRTVLARGQIQRLLIGLKNKLLISGS